MIQYLDVRTRPFITCKGNDCLLPDLHCWKSHIFLSLTDARHGQWPAKVLVFANHQYAYHDCHVLIVNFQVDFDVSRTPSRGDIIGQLGRKQAAMFCWGENFFQAPSRAYVAGATFKEERSSQLSILSLFQVHSANFLFNPCLTQTWALLADHWLCVGPGHTSSCHPPWLQPGIFGGASQVENNYRSAEWLHILLQLGHVHPHRLDQRRCRLSQSHSFLARSISGFDSNPNCKDEECPLRSSCRSFQCHTQRWS